MFVRWLKTKTTNEKKNTYCLHAVLEENVEIRNEANPNPVVHLAAIEERFLKTRARHMREFHQGLFWVVVNQKLDKLNLESGIRDKIERSLSATVPIPPADWALWGVICVPKLDA